MASGGINYVWSNGFSTPSVSIGQAGLISVKVTDSNGCVASTSKTAVVKPLPTANITGNLIICPNVGSTTLTAVGNGTYQWTTPTNVPLTGTTINATQMGIYSLTVTNSNGCKKSTTTTVSNSTLSAKITAAGDTTFCEGGNVVLTASTGNSFQWQTPSGVTQSGQTITATESGIYTLTITEGVCTATATKRITVIAKPTATISASATTICQGGSVTLTASGGDTYRWSNGWNLAVLTLTNVNSFVSITVTVARTGCTQTVTTVQEITVNPKDTVFRTETSCTITRTVTDTLRSTNGFGCEQLIIRTTKPGANDTFRMMANTCDVTKVGETTKVFPRVGRCDSVVITKTSYVPFTATITSNVPSLNICEGKTLTLTATGGGTYLWSTASANNFITVGTGGSYFVTVTNTEGCRSVASINVLVSPKPRALFTYTTLVRTVTTTNQTTGGNRYEWRFGDGGVSVETNPVHTYNANGTYCIQLIAVSDAGCPDTAALQCVTIGGVATQDLPQGIRIEVSPNPFDAVLNMKVTFNTPNSTADFITIYDVLGKPIKRIKLTTSLEPIDSSDWLEGIYWVTVTLDNRQYLVNKVVKMAR